jgi:hypothetical protein
MIECSTREGGGDGRPNSQNDLPFPATPRVVGRRGWHNRCRILVCSCIQVGPHHIYGTPMNQFDMIAREQAKFNSVAAALTGIASLVQVILFYMPSCRDFG